MIPTARLATRDPLLSRPDGPLTSSIGGCPPTPSGGAGTSRETEQIAGKLRGDQPGDPEMWVPTETIYQSLYVQSRGALHQPNRQGVHRKSRVPPDMRNIAERPAEADDRAVPGH